MCTRALFRKWFVFLVCFVFCGRQAFAAGDSVNPLEITVLIVVLILVLLFVPAAFYLRKMYTGFTGQSQKIVKENELLALKQNEADRKYNELEAAKRELEEQKEAVESKAIELESQKNELESQYDALAAANEELAKKCATQETAISTLNSNKKDLEQLLVTKIKESDALQREVADKLSEAESRLKDAELIHDNFFIETIHEMRTPLSLVLGSLSLVVQNKDDSRDMSTQLLSAYRNTLALQDLADQLIGTRRANDVANYLRIARYDLIEISRQICDLFVDWVAMNNVDFQVNTQTSMLWIWLDRRKMEYALRTLLSNAFKNTFVYGKVTLDISVVRKDGKAYCAISVQDEGLNENESTRRGLRQVHDMTDDIGGFYSNETTTSGTTYTLLIPLGKQHLLERRVEFVEPEADLVKLNDRQKEEIAEFIQIVPQKRTTGKKILVIDDSDQIRWFLKHVFAKEYEILEARNGNEGLNVAFATNPDLILCDVMMPVKDGFETCKELKADPRTSQTPVVMLTAKVESEDIIVGLEAGADDYITKPFDIEILRSKLNNLVKRREQLKQYFTKTLAGTVSQETDENESSIPSNPFMDLVVKNIEMHLDDSTFEAKVLADSLNMSLPTLYRKIKQFSDCSILELTRTIRLKKAAELIQTQQYSVQEVAEMVGFNDTATFRKRFTEQYGTTPSQYGQP
ncbi:response regulator [Parabacteroides faecis]|uniref:DNA-binding response OmpR family regulator/signal transduction histidine kinase n=1 Tax=Parabacteroides faecis TaxID=1217282 RepID=A0ABR6KI16_9BACT|nr:response regulator [Parabacteroides faecis]MBB4620444.1 DNA-binding response OmpR family regulator/signal transduction histidine kinase [Parabacteroides faecis]